MRRIEILIASITTLAIIAALLLAWRAGWFEASRLETIRDIARAIRELPFAPATFVAAYALVVVLLLPATVMSIVGGALFGMWGLALAWAGALAGSLLAHSLGRGAGRRVMQRFLGRHPLLERLRQDMSVWDLIRLRVLPVAPFGVLDYLTGMGGLRLRLVLTATALAIIPTMSAYVYAGHQLGRALQGGPGARAALTIAGAVTVTLVLVAVLPTIVRRPWRSTE